MHERAEEAEDRCRRADRQTRSEIWTGEQAHHAAHGEADDAGDRVHDHHAPGAVQVRDLRTELTNPQHVEEDVKEAAVQPAGRQDGPPPSSFEHRHRAAAAEDLQRDAVGLDPDLIALARHYQRQHVHQDGAAGDDVHEAEIAAERAQRRRESPEPRVAAAAVVAGGIVDADQHAARRAEHRALGSALEHWQSVSSSQ